MEYRDGLLVDRNVGEEPHAFLQAALGAYVGSRRRQWSIHPYIALRVRLRKTLYLVSDVCIYHRAEPEGPYPTCPPTLWVEILSSEDRMVDIWRKVQDLVDFRVPYVWIIDPNTLESELRTANGVEKLADKTLRIPNTPIVIPLADVIAE
jgi:Uma2 family endonuclease